MSTLIAGKRTPRRGRSAVPRVLVALILGGLLALTGAQAATAHAELLSTTPEDGAVLDQAPAEAVLTFNEPVQLIDGSIRMFPGDGDPLVLEAHVSDARVVAALPAGLDDAAYALSYRVVSADGHPISGAITFTVGDAAGGDPPAPPAVDAATPGDTQVAVSVLSALQYLALLLVAGLVLFERVVLRSTDPRGRRSATVLRASGIGAIVASLLLIPASALNVTGTSLGAIVDPTAWWPGVLWGPGVAATVVIAGVGGAIVLSTRGRGGRVVAVILSVVALSAPVLVGHAQVREPRSVIIAADIGHLLVGSFWVGGVVGLLLFLAAARVTDGRGSGADPQLAATVVQRFSRTAVWSVVILAVSGTVMGVMIVGSFEALTTTTYGLTLLLKVGIVIPVVAIAGYNRIRLLPKLSARPTARMQWQALTRTLTYEAALLAAILIVTGFLTNLSPAQEHDGGAEEPAAVAQTVTLDAAAQGLSVHGDLRPSLTGTNEIAFELEYEGERIAPGEVRVRTSLPEHDLGPFEAPAVLDPDSGEYSADLDFPVTGEWRIQVIARVSTFAEPIVTIPVAIDELS